MKILIVDDSPDAIALAKARLSKEGLQILTATGGKAGLEIAEREKPDLILLDLDMPEVGGFEVCRALKAVPELCMIPIIFLSGASGTDEMIKGLDLGAVDFVTKPFNAFELRARVRVALRTKHLQEMLMEYAHIDPLTDLQNRRVLMERLAEEWSRIQRRESSFAVVMADIDHFKSVNDTYGHSVGDKLLQSVAQALTGERRTADLVARYGGEEFGILLPDQTAEGATEMAERCRQRIEELSIIAETGIVRVTASFGVADSKGATSPEDLIQRADKQLYRAKESGRNRVCALYTSVKASAR